MPLTNGSVVIALNDPEHGFAPGEEITGTAKISLEKQLSLCEFTLEVYGRAFTRINRTYLYQNFQAEWRGQGFMFKRYIVLIQHPTILSPGQHDYQFRFQLPLTTEQVRGNWRLFNKWKQRDPFAGKNTFHAIPPSMPTIACNQTWGSADAHVQYVIKTIMKRGPEEKWHSMMPKALETFKVAAPPQPDFPNGGLWQQLERTLQVANEAVNITCRIPQVLVQRDRVPIYMKADHPGLVLTNLKIKLYVVFLIRARNVIWPEKRTKCTYAIQLAKWDGNRAPISLSTDFALVDWREISDNIPVSFTTFNLACLAHWMEIKYRVAAAGSKKEVKGQMENISVRVQSWKPHQTQEIQRKEVDGERNGGSEEKLFTEAEYRTWIAQIKKSKA